MHNLKKVGQYVLLAWWLYLWAKAIWDKISDHQKTHQQEIVTTLEDNAKKSYDFDSLKQSIAKAKKENESLRRMKHQLEEVIAYQKSIMEHGQHFTYNKEIGKSTPHGDITYIHQDKTTTEILNALSGFDTKILYSDTAKEIIWEQDSVMYKAIWAMHTKYNNPKVKLVDKFEDKTTRANYDARENMVGLQKSTTNKKSPLNQKYYLESWIAELSHAYQVKRDGLRKHEEKILDDNSLITEEKKTYNDLYGMGWTIENEAHSVIEKKLKKEFVDLYTSLCDTSNVDHLYTLLALNAWLLECYFNMDEIEKYCEKILVMEGSIKKKWLMKNIESYYVWHKFEAKYLETQDKKYLELAKLFYLNWSSENSWAYYALARLCASQWDIEGAMKYLGLEYPELNKHSVWESVALLFLQVGKYEEAMKIYEEQAKEGSRYAMFCLMKLYDPECLDEYEKGFPGKNQEKKEYREDKFIETKNKCNSF